MKKYFPILLSVLIIFVIYNNWFVASEIIGGDWPYLFKEYLTTLSILPPSWSNIHGNGLGGTILSYGLDQYLYLSSYIGVQTLNLSWGTFSKISWFWVFILLSSYSTYYFLKAIFTDLSAYKISIGILVYLTNTYILMLVSGGQMGIALGYAITPLLIGKYINLSNLLIDGNLGRRFLIRSSLQLGILLGILLLLDVRVFYMVIVIFFIFSAFQLLSKKNKKLIPKIGMYLYLFPSIISVILNASWILPLFFQSGITGAVEVNKSFAALDFYSFANFSDSFTLLHPNWPENIFGKIVFMRPEFIVLPIIAFIPMLIVQKKSSVRYLLLFPLLIVIGSFLAKGTNDPFGQVYYFLYENIPGFVLFRDPTKWYILIVLGYTVLLVNSFNILMTWVPKFKKTTSQQIQLACYLIFITIFLLLQRQAIIGQIDGTFTKNEIPKEYIDFKNRVLSDEKFYRTLWIPKQSRFTFTTHLNPSVEANTFFKETNIKKLSQHISSNNMELLRSLGIKFIIVPSDPSGEIFNTSENTQKFQRDSLVKNLDNNSYLKKVSNSNLDIYELKEPNSLFTIDDIPVKYTNIGNSRYRLSLEDQSRKSNLFFAQNYNPSWVAVINGIESPSTRSKYGINEFKLNTHVSKVDIYFNLEKYYIIGRYIALVSLLIILGAIVIIGKKNEKK